jgi:small subunit ribosomal protein S20
MPHIPVHPSARKRHRQSLKRQARNRAIKTRVRGEVKKAAQAIAGGDKQAALAQLHGATRVLYKAVSKGVLHRNTAARKVGRLAKALARTTSSSATASS